MKNRDLQDSDIKQAQYPSNYMTLFLPFQAQPAFPTSLGEAETVPPEQIPDGQLTSMHHFEQWSFSQRMQYGIKHCFLPLAPFSPFSIRSPALQYTVSQSSALSVSLPKEKNKFLSKEARKAFLAVFKNTNMFHRVREGQSAPITSHQEINNRAKILYKIFNVTVNRFVSSLIQSNRQDLAKKLKEKEEDFFDFDIDDFKYGLCLITEEDIQKSKIIHIKNTGNRNTVPKIVVKTIKTLMRSYTLEQQIGLLDDWFNNFVFEDEFAFSPFNLVATSPSEFKQESSFFSEVPQRDDAEEPVDKFSFSPFNLVATSPSEFKQESSFFSEVPQRDDAEEPVDKFSFSPFNLVATSPSEFKQESSFFSEVQQSDDAEEPVDKFSFSPFNLVATSPSEFKQAISFSSETKQNDGYAKSEGPTEEFDSSPINLVDSPSECKQEGGEDDDKGLDEKPADVEIKLDSNPTARISIKHSGLVPIPSKPMPSLDDSKKITYSQEMKFIPVGLPSERINNEFSNPWNSHDLILNEGDIIFSYFSGYRFDFSQKQKYIFILAERGLDALAPSDDSVRVVLVMPDKDFKKNQFKINHKEFDVLSLIQMKSASHGDFSDKLGCMTSRRVAILLFAHHIGLNNFMIMDDNIKKIEWNEEHDDTEEHFTSFLDIFEKMEKTSPYICTSIATKSHTDRQNTYRLGSTVFHIDLEKIKEKLALRKKSISMEKKQMIQDEEVVSSIENMFLFLPPAECADWWGGDYFMQLMFYNLDLAQGYTIFDREKIAIECSKKQSDSKEIVSKADIYFNQDLIEKINADRITSEELSDIKATVAKLQEVIVENKIKNQEGHQNIEECDLIYEHARANRLPSFDKKIEIHNKMNLDGETVFMAFQKNISRRLNEFKPLLKKHQHEAMTIMARTGLQQGCFMMTTGSGKTCVQIVLSLLMHDLGVPKPIIIVTPTMELVEQFYQDFLRWNEKFQNRSAVNLPEQHIIKIDSDSKNINVNLFLENKKIHNNNLIYIICKDSYLHLLEKNSDLLQSTITLLDECHKIESDSFQQILDFHTERNLLLYGFTATPNKRHALKRIYEYTREQGVNDGILAPLIVHQFSENYNKKYLHDIAKFVTQHKHPSGVPLTQLKGIIYFSKNIDYLTSTKNILESQGINCYIIHSTEVKQKENIKIFQEASGPAIGLCVRKLQIGYDDRNLNWTLIAKKGENATEVAQIVGRVVRKNPKEADKVGYVITFNNCSMAAVFSQQKLTNGYLFDKKAMEYIPTWDPLSLKRCSFLGIIAAYEKEKNSNNKKRKDSKEMITLSPQKDSPSQSPFSFFSSSPLPTLFSPLNEVEVPILDDKRDDREMLIQDSEWDVQTCDDASSPRSHSSRSSSRTSRSSKEVFLSAAQTQSKLFHSEVAQNRSEQASMKQGILLEMDKSDSGTSSIKSFKRLKMG